MCFHIQIHSTIQQITERFGIKNVSGNAEIFLQKQYLKAFDYPYVPVIINTKKEELQFFRWGLIPGWSKDENIKKFTLNAKMETILEKPSFKYYVSQRCLVIVDGFYEWKWLDPKGKIKEKYFITVDRQPKPFALGGLYSIWKNPETKEILPTFTILTKQATGIMTEIHNSKQRMPLILHKDIEFDWLEGKKNDIPDVPLLAIRI